MLKVLIVRFRGKHSGAKMQIRKTHDGRRTLEWLLIKAAQEMEKDAHEPVKLRNWIEC